MRKGLMAQEALDESLELFKEMKEEVQEKQASAAEIVSDEVEEAIEEQDEEMSDDVQNDTSESEVSLEETASTPITEVSNERTSVAAESLRDIHYAAVTTRSRHRIVASEMHHLLDGASALAIYTFEQIKELTKLLIYLGVRYVPKMIEGLRKGVYSFFIRIVRQLKKLDETTRYQAHRFSLVFDTHLNDIKTLKETVKRLAEEKAVLPDESLRFQNTRTISWLSKDDDEGLIPMATSMERFLGSSVGEINRRVEDDIEHVIKLAKLGGVKFPGNILETLKVNTFSGDFQARQIAGYEVDQDLLTSVVYQGSLPDQTRFAIQVPRQDLDSVDDYAKAYQKSRIFLTFEKRNGTDSRQEMDYMTAQDLLRYLERIEAVALLSKKHQSVYVKVHQSCKKLKTNYADYWNRLVGTEHEVSLIDSLAEYIFLKQAFISSVYIPAAMNVHDFTSAYLTRAIRFSQENVKALQSQIEKTPN